MSDKAEDQNEESGKKSEKTQDTFTKEEVEALISDKLGALQKEYDGIQSGLQKKLDEALKAVKAEEDKGKTIEEKNAERIAALEKLNEAKDVALTKERMLGIGRKMLSDASIPEPPHVGALVGNDEETTRKNFEDFIEYEKGRTAEQNKAHDRKHGRRVTGSEDEKPDSYEALFEMTPDEIRAMDPKDVAAIIDAKMGT